MINTNLHFVAAGCCTGAAVFALVRDRRSFVHRSFGLGMVLLALETFFNGRCIQAIFPEAAIRWQHWRFVAAATWPGVWLLFSLSFGREDFRELVFKWKWVVLGCFLIPVSFVSLLWENFFRDDPIRMANGWGFVLGWSGYGFHLCFLLILVMVLMMLEKTLRASRGRKRWQIKFLVVGMGGYFACRLFTASHALIFHTVDMQLDVISAAVLLAANLLVVISIIRSKILQMDIYMSQKMLYNSITIMVVGVYFLALGISSKIATPLLPFSVLALFVFVSLLALLMVLLSDRVRLKTKRFISRHLKRPQYDYREIWRNFTGRTASLVQEKAFCESVVRLISEMLDVLNVSIWMIDENQKGFRCAGSTALSETGAQSIPLIHSGFSDIVQHLYKESALIDLEEPADLRFLEFDQAHKDMFSGIRTRYLVSLSAGDDLLGFISVGDPVKYRSLSLEEKDILGTIAEQVAAGLLNIKLSERIRQAGEMEAFQAVAAFFVHDLKNLASKLSLMLDNMPKHFDNADFREDALKTMSRSVDQINTMCSRLSVLREKLDIHPVQTDINQLVTATLTGLNGPVAQCLHEKLHPVPKILADPDQIRKVVLNLILNAGDAVEGEGEIVVCTGTRDGWVTLSVTDNGCGISKEFMDHFLFRPFKTTKDNGTGIGLFQSKMIVEAHNGIMEVDSREGQGTTFRVLLPIT